MAKTIIISDKLSAILENLKIDTGFVQDEVLFADMAEVYRVNVEGVKRGEIPATVTSNRKGFHPIPSAGFDHARRNVLDNLRTLVPHSQEPEPEVLARTA